MKWMLLMWLFSVVPGYDMATRYFTKTGTITFFSKSPLEDIEASNRSVACVLDTESGQIQLSVLMKGFEFRKATMQEHFNEDYVESDKYPRSSFRGQITNKGSIAFDKDGVYQANVKGDLTMHGETRPVEATGTIVIKEGKIALDSKFNVLLSDYKIAIPKLVKDNISNSISIHVQCRLEELKQ